MSNFHVEFVILGMPLLLFVFAIITQDYMLAVIGYSILIPYWISHLITRKFPHLTKGANGQ